MHTIMVSDETFQLLQARARPLIDTVDDVLNRLLAPPAAPTLEPVPSMPQDRPVADDPWIAWPSADRRLLRTDTRLLTHTRLLRAHVAGAVDVTKWNDLVRHCVRLAVGRGTTVEAINAASPANVRGGRFEENGYTYIADIGVSVQGVAADTSWLSAAGIAKLLGEPLAVMFEWRDKKDAAYRGQTGLLVAK